MEPVATLGLHEDEPGRLEDLKVLGDPLTACSDPVSSRQPSAQLEERQTVLTQELIEDQAPGLVGDRLVDVIHESRLGKYLLACQSPSLTSATRLCGQSRGTVMRRHRQSRAL